MSDLELNLYRHHEEILFGAARKRVLPIVVVTGFLGAGKTTLLQHILRKRENLRIATCVHEKADVNIDSLLLRTQFVEVENPFLTPSQGEMQKEGWVIPLQCADPCCYDTSLGDTLRIFLKEGVDCGKIDCCVIETSGVEDPSSIIQLVNQNFGHMYRCRLDTVISIVDAANILATMENPKKKIWVQKQLAFTDLVNLFTPLDALEDHKMKSTTPNPPRKIREFWGKRVSLGVSSEASP